MLIMVNNLLMKLDGTMKMKTRSGFIHRSHLTIEFNQYYKTIRGNSGQK